MMMERNNCDSSNTPQPQQQQQQQQQKQQFACLYTAHKTQKRKVWKDGRLILTLYEAILHDAIPMIGSDDPSLDSCEVTHGQRQSMMMSPSGQTLETEKYLIEVEGPWTGFVAAAKPTSIEATKLSSSVQKVLRKKFQKPKAFVPPHPAHRPPSRLEEKLGKRRRPLQPGELIQIHHGLMASDAEAPGDVLTGNQNYNKPRFPAYQPSQHVSNYSQQSASFRPLRHGAMETLRPESQASHPGGNSTIVSNTSLTLPTALTAMGGQVASHNDTLVTFRDINTFRPKPQNGPRLQSFGLFASNEFNPGKYYGLEDEDEDNNNGEHGDSKSTKRPRVGHTVAQTMVCSEVQDSLPTESSNHPISAYQSSQNHVNQTSNDLDASFPMARMGLERSGLQSKIQATGNDSDSDESGSSVDGVVDSRGPMSFSLVRGSSNQQHGSTDALSSNEMLALFGMAPISPEREKGGIVNVPGDGTLSGKENNAQNTAARDAIHKPVIEPFLGKRNPSTHFTQGMPSRGFVLAPAESSSTNDSSSDDGE